MIFELVFIVEFTRKIWEQPFLGKKKCVLRKHKLRNARCLMWLEITGVQVGGENNGEEFGSRSHRASCLRSLYFVLAAKRRQWRRLGVGVKMTNGS